MKLLLVEDNPEMQTTLQRALRASGMQVVPCTDGDRALDRWRASLPDVVVLDLSLPGRDGLEVLRDARAEGLRAPVLTPGAQDLPGQLQAALGALTLDARAALRPDQWLLLDEAYADFADPDELPKVPTRRLIRTRTFSDLAGTVLVFTANTSEAPRKPVTDLKLFSAS